MIARCAACGGPARANYCLLCEAKSGRDLLNELAALGAVFLARQASIPLIEENNNEPQR